MDIMLTILKGANKGRQYPIVQGQSIKLGRGSNADILLHDTMSSRLHCQISNQGSQVVVSDLDSSNGTFLNEKPLKAAKVYSGDRLRIGTTVFEFRGVESGTIPAMDEEEDDDDDVPVVMVEKSGKTRTHARPAEMPSTPPELAGSPDGTSDEPPPAPTKAISLGEFESMVQEMEEVAADDGLAEVLPEGGTRGRAPLEAAEPDDSSGETIPLRAADVEPSVSDVPSDEELLIGELPPIGEEPPDPPATRISERKFELDEPYDVAGTGPPHLPSTDPRISQAEPSEFDGPAVEADDEPSTEAEGDDGDSDLDIFEPKPFYEESGSHFAASELPPTPDPDEQEPPGGPVPISSDVELSTAVELSTSPETKEEEPTAPGKIIFELPGNSAGGSDPDRGDKKLQTALIESVPGFDYTDELPKCMVCGTPVPYDDLLNGVAQETDRGYECGNCIGKGETEGGPFRLEFTEMESMDVETVDEELLEELEKSGTDIDQLLRLPDLPEDGDEEGL